MCVVYITNFPVLPAHSTVVLANNQNKTTMPALLERPKLSKAMASALRVHVVKERERKRQEEEEADKAIERKKQEQERLRKRQEAETLSLEDTKEQVNNMEEKLKSLQQEKHELFLQLKKVLNEDENRRRQQESKKNEMLVAMSQSYHPAMQLPGPHMLVQSGSLARPTLLGDGPKGHYYRGTQTPPSQAVQSVKRSRSPSPPVVDLYPKHHIQGSHYPHVAYTQSQVTHAHSPYRQQGHIAYTTAQAPSSSFINQSASGYPPTQQPVHANYASSSQSNPNKYQARESAFSSYGNHFATAQKGIAEQISQSYQQQQQQHQQQQQQQQQQQRYLQGAPSSSLHSASHHGVEQSRKASSEGDDQGYYQAKLQGQQHLRQLNSGHPQAIHHQSGHQPLLTQGQVQGHIQPAQTKPSIPTSFATHGRRKTDSPVYHKKPSQQHGANYPPGQGGGRSGYGSAQGQHQGTGRYYQGH